MRPLLVVFLAVLAGADRVVAAPLDDLPARVTTALRAASSAMQALARGGGYPTELAAADGAWLRPELAAGQVAVGPDGTAAVGLALVEAFRVTGDTLHRDGALAAARALAAGQLASGGWAAVADLSDEPANYLRRLRLRSVPPAGRADRSSLAPPHTPAALALLAAAADLTADRSLREAADYGLRAVLNAQLLGGGWPAAMPLPEDDGRHAQVEATAALVELLLKLGAEPAIAAQRGGDFLLQSLTPQSPGWAAAYDGLRPLGATSAAATCAAVSALLALHAATGQERFVTTLEPLVPALPETDLAAELRRRVRQPSLPPRQPSRLELASRTADGTPRVLELLAALQGDRWLTEDRLLVSEFAANLTYLTAWLRDYEPLPERPPPTDTRPPQHRRM